MPARCRSCDAPVIWAYTPRGKRMPVDAELGPRPDGFSGALYRLGSEIDGTPTLERLPSAASEGYVSHFATCPEANDWSKR